MNKTNEMQRFLDSKVASALSKRVRNAILRGYTDGKLKKPYELLSDSELSVLRSFGPEALKEFRTQVKVYKANLSERIANMNIKNSHWFTGMNFTIGIVTGVDEVTKKPKAYIGLGRGFDPDVDTKLIAQQGSPVSPIILNEIASFFRTREQKDRDKQLVNGTLDLMADLDPVAFKAWLCLHPELCEPDQAKHPAHDGG